MNELINQLSISFDENFSVINFLIYILICGALLYILSLLYIKYGRSISNRSQLSKVLILVGLTTFIIITIVKSSLALSLGLVGALSIVRFRTAIKEPEELGYFFIAISLGLGLGAYQLLPTLIGFFMLTLTIIFLSQNKINKSISQHLIISLNLNNLDKEEILERINKILSDNANQVDLKRLKSNKDEINVNYLINVTSFNDLNTINDNLNSIDSNIDLTFIDSQV